MKISKCVFIILITICLCCCQATPTSNIHLPAHIDTTYNNENHVDSSIQSGEAIDTTSSNQTVIDLNTHEELFESFTSANNISLNIDAKVNECLADTRQLYVYDLNIDYDIDVVAQKAAEVFFGIESECIIYDDQLGSYIYDADTSDREYFTLYKDSFLISASGHSKNLCPYASNRFPSNTIDDNESNKAIQVCSDFLTDIGLVNYELDYLFYYGKEIGEPFYNINMCLKINNMPVVSKIMATKCSFDIADNRVYAFDLCHYDLIPRTLVTNPLSLDQAVEKLKQQIDLITIKPRKGSEIEYFLNGNGAIVQYNIVEISYEYIARKKGDTIVVSPSWRFILGDASNQDRSILLAIDSQTGEVIF